MDAKTDTQKFANNELKFTKDIYSFAYAAQIHPMELEEFDKKKKYMMRVQLLPEERNTLYLQAILVSLVQMSTIIVIMVFFDTGKGVHLIPADRFLVLVPRLISTMMMHLNVEPDIRQGIELMKFAVNHPQKFRCIKKDSDKETPESISYVGCRRRAFCAFMLGFNQCTIGILAEVLVIYFLNSLNDLLLIIMKYVSFAAVVKFDDMYGAALGGHVITQVGGHKLAVTNKRRFRLQRALEKQ